MNRFNIFYSVLFVLFFSFVFEKKTINAQDFHYSQFYNAPLVVNPALAGIFNGDERILGSIRDQWRSIPVPWFTVSLGYDRKFYLRDNEKSFLGGGIYLNYDTQGDSNIQLGNINVAVSYTRLLNTRNVITVGGLIGFSQRGLNTENLTWDRFWDPNTFTVTPVPGGGEPFSFESFNFLETAVGLNYRWQKTSRTKLDLGVGVFHLQTPKARFSTSGVESQELPIRLSAYAIYHKQLSDKLDLQLDGLYQFQTTFDEFVVAGYVNLYLNENRGEELKLRLGVGYRSRQAIFPKVGIEYKNLFVSVSYDIYFNEFAREHGGAGPEAHFAYIIKHVKPLGKFKNCPIF